MVRKGHRQVVGLVCAAARIGRCGDCGEVQGLLSYGGLHLDLRTRRAKIGDCTVDLSAREFALAETFLRHPGQVLSRKQLLSRVWGYGFDPGSNVVDVYVRYLRRKLGTERFATLRGWAIGSTRCPEELTPSTKVSRRRASGL